MPYVPQEMRTTIVKMLPGLYALPELTAGQINFIITRLITLQLVYRGVSYASLSEMRGILHDVHDELGRRVMGPYEDKKKEQHGDVFDCISRG